MPLTLISGPPKSGRAGEIRARLTAALPAEPVLVVPNRDDVIRFERELSEGGTAVLGASVRTFQAFFQDVADATGAEVPAELGDARRRRAIELAARDCGDPRLRALSSRPGFLRALAETITELQEGRVQPESLERAAAEESDGAHLGGLADAYRGYLALRERIGRTDRHRVAELAIAGLRAAPDAWGGRAVLIYGFDDLTELQFAVVDALAAATSVTVAVTYEVEREVASARATLHERLREVADETVALPPEPDYTNSAILFAIERELFEDEPARTEPDEGLVLMESAGELAEAEAIGAEIAALIAAGAEPDEIAIAMRATQRLGPLYAGVLARLGVPAAVHAALPLAATGAGAGIIALLRAAERGEAADLIAHLRGPAGPRPRKVDWLERNVRRKRLRGLEDALANWDRDRDRGNYELTELAKVRGESDPAELCRVVARIARGMIGGERRRREAATLSETEELEARAAEHAAVTAQELAELGELAPGLPELRATLEALEVPTASAQTEGKVQVTTPYRLRASRLTHVFVASLQEGEFPAAEPRSGVLSDDERAAVGLPARPDAEAEERYLFYVCTSWPTERLYLSWRIAAEDGSAESPSPFVEEVREVLAPPPPRRAGEPDTVLAGLTRVRGADSVVLAPEEAPSERELARALAARGRGTDHSGALTALGMGDAESASLAAGLEAAAGRFALPDDLDHPLVLAGLTDRPPLGASTLEEYAVCSYRWFVNHEMRPQTLEPPPEPLSQGSVVHATLEQLYRDPPEPEGVPRPATLATWRAHATELLSQTAEEMGLGPHDAARRAGLERMRTLVSGFLARESKREWRVRPDPELLEAKFGDDAEVGALDLGGFQMRGSIDRVDVAEVDGRRMGLVRDYKLSSAVTAPARFEEEGKLQLQLYMLALRDLFGVEPIGGLYEPLASDGTKKPRGPILDEARGELLDAKSTSTTDALSAEEFEATLTAAHATATDVVDRMRGGQVTRNPLGGVCPRWCTFQPICRRERAPLADREDTKSENGEDER